MKTAYEYNKELIRKVTPSMAYNGGDLLSWQKSAKEKLSLLLGMDKFTKVNPSLEIEYETEIENASEIRFTFSTEDGYRAVAHLLIPDGIEKPPVMICLQGHSKGMHISLGRPKYEGDSIDISEGDRDFCVRALKEEYAAVALEQRNFGELGGSEKGPRCYESAMTALLMGRTTIGERVWDVMRLIDVLYDSFSDRVDVNLIGCMGNSGGGTATAYAAALEERVKLAMPSCAMCTFRDSIGAMEHCSCNYVPEIANYFDMGDLMAMAYPKFFVQVSGKDDPIFPIDGAREVFNIGKAAYEAQGDSNRCYLAEGNGGHRYYADDSWPVVHKFFGR